MTSRSLNPTKTENVFLKISGGFPVYIGMDLHVKMLHCFTSN